MINCIKHVNINENCYLINIISHHFESKRWIYYIYIQLNALLIQNISI